MKKRTILPLVALTLMGLSSAACAQTAPPRTFCRFVPERADDFAWENDKIAFRAYGPALREGAEDSGIDCWLKRVEYPIIDKWYKNGDYHKDHGEGSDPYHVGSSRGCGGLGLWIDGKLVLSDTYTEWKIIQCEPIESVFLLTYEYKVGDDTYKEEKRITIKLGDRLFKAVSTFWKNGVLAADLPIAVGITTHDGKATPSKDVSKGWMACWETIKKQGLGTGVVMDPVAIKEYKLIESKTKDASHVLFITQTDAKGQVEYYAGYGWEKAGEIKTSKDWNLYLEQYALRNTE
jgi:hypothetical protein